MDVDIHNAECSRELGDGEGQDHPCCQGAQKTQTSQEGVRDDDAGSQQGHG